MDYLRSMYDALSPVQLVQNASWREILAPAARRDPNQRLRLNRIDTETVISAWTMLVGNGGSVAPRII